MMIILDTNVPSELMTGRAAASVVRWIDSQPPGSLFTTAISEAEILAGLAAMPAGRRRADLKAAADTMFRAEFEGRVLVFDSEAAEAYADLFATRRRVGRPPATADLMIAAIARVHGACVATRNIADFEACELALVNPWLAA